MPRNPDKTPCSVPDCRAWAVRDTHPPLCSAHAGRTTGAGAPDGNQNRRTHGFYAAALSRDELADLVAGAPVVTLDAEIACARIALRRVLTHLAAMDPALSPLEYARIAGIVFYGARTVACLLRHNQALGGEPSSELAVAIEIAMVELGQELGVDLGPPAGPRAHAAASSAHRPTNGPGSDSQPATPCRAPAAPRRAPATPRQASSVPIAVHHSALTPPSCSGLIRDQPAPQLASRVRTSSPDPDD